jgi:hypothetical protein
VWVFGMWEGHVWGWLAADRVRDWLRDSWVNALGALWADVEDVEEETGYAGHCGGDWEGSGRVLRKSASSGLLFVVFSIFSPFCITLSEYAVTGFVLVVVPVVVVVVVLRFSSNSSQQIATDSNKTSTRQRPGSLSPILVNPVSQLTTDIVSLAHPVHTRRPSPGLAKRPSSQSHAHHFRPNLRTLLPGRIPVSGRSHSNRSGRGPHQVRLAAWIERHDVVFVGGGLA